MRGHCRDRSGRALPAVDRSGGRSGQRGSPSFVASPLGRRLPRRAARRRALHPPCGVVGRNADAHRRHRTLAHFSSRPRAAAVRACDLARSRGAHGLLCGREELAIVGARPDSVGAGLWSRGARERSAGDVVPAYDRGVQDLRAVCRVPPPVAAVVSLARFFRRARDAAADHRPIRRPGATAPADAAGAHGRSPARDRRTDDLA